MEFTATFKGWPERRKDLFLQSVHRTPSCRWLDGGDYSTRMATARITHSELHIPTPGGKGRGVCTSQLTELGLRV